MNKGWIKIHRSIIDTADFYDEPLCKMACWTDLIMMAEIEPQVRKSKCGDLFINRGEVAISIGKLAERWNHSVRHCRTIIGWLIKTERIQVRTDKQLTIIKIINYDKYQCTTTSDKVIDKVTDKVSDKVSDKVTDKVDFDVTTNGSTNYNDKKIDTDKVTDKVSDKVGDKVTDKVSDNIIKNNKEYIKNNIKKISANADIKESRNQNEIDFEKLCELWNQQMIDNNCTIPQIQRITDRRKQAVLSRLREFSKDEILKVIENCARSDFPMVETIATSLLHSIGHSCLTTLSRFSKAITTTNLKTIQAIKMDYKLDYKQIPQQSAAPHHFSTPQPQPLPRKTVQ